jgi:hypothetical protein
MTAITHTQGGLYWGRAHVTPEAVLALMDVWAAEYHAARDAGEVEEAGRVYALVGDAGAALVALERAGNPRRVFG